jgi:hypothetical protein
MPFDSRCRRALTTNRNLLPYKMLQTLPDWRSSCRCGVATALIHVASRVVGATGDCSVWLARRVNDESSRCAITRDYLLRYCRRDRHDGRHLQLCANRISSRLRVLDWIAPSCPIAPLASRLEGWRSWRVRGREKIFRSARFFWQNRRRRAVMAADRPPRSIHAGSIRPRPASRSHAHHVPRAYGTRGPCRTRR